MKDSLGQDSSIWNNWWGKISPLSEIRMWDYYGGRQWISKYTPRYGKVIEGGCGVGRYNFYFSKFGIDIDGIDFSPTVIKRLEEVKNSIVPNASFVLGDITKLPYEDNSVSGYISLGVVEHFIEGPQQPIAEAFRVLRPGGIAIITTPNKSFYIRYRNLKNSLKKMVKMLIGKRIVKPPFFQYEYSPNELKKFCEKQGFYVSRAEGCDLLYVFNEIGGFSGKNLSKDSFAYRFSHMFENTGFKNLGAQSITISVKVANKMHCFLSGELNATPESLKNFDVPISEEMQNSPLAELFRKGRKVKYAKKYIIKPAVNQVVKKKCEFTNLEYETDEIFEDFGFSVNVSPSELRKKETNILCSVEHIQPVWRNRTDAK